MKILITGGRDYWDKQNVFVVLDKIKARYDVEEIIVGGAKGVDTFAEQWARDREVPFTIVHADWNTHGKKAGVLRNIKMLDLGKPDFVLAFPGGRGTEHMKKHAKTKGYTVIEIT